ncbi:hypothetical protein [Streptomyces telluris]|uniref:Uncharacterized protein n=1 Tax=Streptomyces telluris TaxID=2720021 RepID=A0A9X2LL70_9ACTN|nr:hypothetical protein [Streptomyces telluris]MCQ8773297.1 hypothetical protein [Streptomyces telluris]NJP78783.1 hypothetical protein [Streptomyces telluris]
MSQPWQQPQQPQQPPQHNPYGQPPPQPYPPQHQPHAPQQPPFGYGQQPPPPYGPPGGFPPPPPPVRRGNPGLALVLGFVAMLVGAAVYGGILKASDGGQIGYLAVGTGALIGAALGKVGGRNPALPVVGVLLGLLGVYLGQIFGIALELSDVFRVPVTEILFEHFDSLSEAWQEYLEPIDALFFILGGAGAFQTARKLGG